MNEAFLQYVWQHQLLEGDLRTVEGLPIVVERPGLLNRDSGPDFSNAQIRIGDTLWVGNVEVHVRSSDWNLHRHSNNRAYDNVVLHVVYLNDSPLTLQNTHPLPTLQLRDHIPQLLWDNYEALVNPPDPLPVPCASWLPEVSELYISGCLERLLLERLESKCQMVQRHLEESHGNWEQCCYVLLAHYFGGKANALPFELLAQSNPQTLLARWRDKPQRIEALLFGQAGLLQGYFSDDYPRQLQADYEALRHGVALKPIAAHMWRFFRIRPYSFPTLRISQFAQLICRSHNLFSRLLDTPSAADIQQLFSVSASSYWDNHFHFDRPSPGTAKRVGADFVDMLIINAWIPLLFEYGCQHAQQHYKDRAVDLLLQLKPENNRIVRQWASVGVKARHAAQSQALIQLTNNYCTHRNCLRCQIGYKIITH